MLAWEPSTAVCERSQLMAFLRLTGERDFTSLYRHSIEDVQWFTEQSLRFLGIEFRRQWEQLLDVSRGVEWVQWCVGAELNIAENCLDRQIRAGGGARRAVVWEREDGAGGEMSYQELANKVSRCAAGLRALGLRRGDAVAIHLPMSVETVIALLAIARIGAIAVPLFSGFGPAAIASRLEDCQARVLISCDGFLRRGQEIPALRHAEEAVQRCAALRHVVVVNRLLRKPELKAGQLSWEELLAAGSEDRAEATGAEDPLLLIYTSGTTGRPKGIVHTQCSFPVKAAQDMAFCMDAGVGDRVCWITDIGWMMGPWLIYGALLVGATVVLYDGAPDYPGPDRLWRFASRREVTVLGLSPTLVRHLLAFGEEPVVGHDLSALRILGSTGEPWNEEPWWWLFKNVGRGRLPIINYSGGTEIAGGILSNFVLLPIKACGFSSPCLGMAADVVDEGGRPVREQVGELVIRKPWIGMARGFWRDPQRYLETYWKRWPGLWRHGDWARIDEDGHWFILGRSDDTIKVAGKRVGPAEVESILGGHPAVLEAAAVGVPHAVKGNVVVVFCVLRSEWKADPVLAEELKQRVAAELGKALQPEAVVFLEALPKTRNGKIMRRVARAAWLGEEAGDLTALEDPAVIEAIRQARFTESGGQNADLPQTG